MLSGAETEVFHLKTYPIMKRTAVLEGVTNTIVARRTGSDAPFVSVLETYADRPAARSIQAFPCDIPGAFALRLVTRGGERLLVCNPEPERPLTVRAGPRPVRLDGHFALVRLAGNGTVAGAVLVASSQLQYGDVTFRTDRPVNLCLRRQDDGRFSATAAADLAYETLDGEPLYAACDDVRVAVTEGGKRRRLKARGAVAGAR